MYCHLLLCPGSCTLEAWGHKCGKITLEPFSKGGKEPQCGRLLQAADRCCMLLSDHRADPRQFFFFFLVWSLLTPLRRGYHPSLSAAQSGLLRQDTITRTLQGGWWISWPPGCGSNNPCSPVSKCRSGAEQLKVAGAAVGEPLQDQER